MIEAIQKSFTRKITSNGKQDYWDRLKSLRIYSLERRRERYRIIYVWKILENIVPNLTTEQNQIKSNVSLRFGRQCVVPPLSRSSSSRVRTLREESFSVHGAKLFNGLPQHIRDMTGVELPEFKKKLDEFLLTVPDEPQSPGYTDTRRAESNSLLHMIRTASQ